MRNVTEMGTITNQVVVGPRHWIVVVVDADNRAFAVEAREQDDGMLTTTSAPIDVNDAVVAAQAALSGAPCRGPVNAQFRMLAVGLLAVAGLAKSCAHEPA